MQQSTATDPLVLARVHMLLNRYTVPLDGSGEDLRSRQQTSLQQQIDEQPPYKLQEEWAAEGRLGICPEFFVAEMQWRWVNELGNVVTAKLRNLWRAEAETFNSLISAKPGDPWPILRPETGTGKTQGTCVYAALSALYTDTGLLITTRLVSQCEDGVEQIHKIADSHCSRYPESGQCRTRSFPIAITDHSKLSAEEKPSKEAIQGTPCLVITHERMSRIYKEGLENEGSFIDKGLSRFAGISEWDKGRRIRITDETPLGLVESFQLDEGVFGNLRYFFSPTEEYPDEIREPLELVTCIERACRQYWRRETEQEDSRIIALGDFLLKGDRPRKFQLQELFKAVRAAPEKSSNNNAEETTKLKEKAIKCLLALQHVANSWAVAISNLNGIPAATSAWLIAPPDNLPMCVLDATAFTCPFWRVLGPRIRFVDIESGIRDYRTVTAHLRHIGGIGSQEAFRKHGKERLKAVLSYFEAEAPHRDRKRKVLICVPKWAKKNIPELAVVNPEAEGEDSVTAIKVPEYLEALKVGHWQALDGRNLFRECDTVVTMSWPYPPQNMAIDLLFADADPELRTDEYLTSKKDFLKQLDLGHVGASVIQAVNRGRCRKVTSEDGSCDPMDIFMFMDKETSGDTRTMRETLEREMPNMVFRDWDILKEDGPKVRSGTSAERLLAFLRNTREDRIVVSEALSELGVKPKAQERLRSQMKNINSTLGKAVVDLGWTYSLTGVGRGAVAVLKRADS